MAAADKAGLDAVANAARRAWYVQPAEVTKLMTEHEFVYFYTAALEGLLDLTHKFVPELTAKIDAFKRAIPASRVTMIDEAGHLPHVEQLEHTLAAMLEFIEG